MRPPLRATSVLFLAIAIGCASDGGDGGQPDATPGDPDVQVGAFEVELVAPREAVAGQPARPGRTSVLGTVYDGPQPSPVGWILDAEVGDCALYLPRVPFCETPCDSDAVCVADDVCQPYATKGAVGVVTMTGIETADGDTSFAMEPVADNYQPPAGVTVAYPGVTEGEPVGLSAAGSGFAGAFAIATDGIAALALGRGRLALAEGTPLALAWTAPSVAGSAIEVKLDISHHGGSKGKIACATADDGELTVDAALVDGLLALGAAGFPTIVIARARTGSTVIGAGRVDLALRAEVETSIDVPGVRSCTEDDDCDVSQGETCRDDYTCG